MRLFIASLATETNAFAPFPTGRSAFEETGISRAASITLDGFGAEGMAAWRTRAEAEGVEVVESISASAEPGGKTVRAAYEEYRNTILADLSAALPIDIILLMLHGAMVADGYDDCEGDLIARVRAIAPNAVIGVELDPHCHMTEAMVAAADVIVAFKEYPHIDVADRARDLIDLALRTARGTARPVPVLLETHMVGLYPTFAGPMKEIVAELRALEARPGILSASIAHGFPWADVAAVGTRVLVYGDGDPSAAEGAATEIADRLYAAREALRPRYPGIADSLDRAGPLNGVVVLGDHSDNPGGGAPGDSTFFLREIVARGLTDAVVGVLHDPAVARIAADAGVGANLRVRLGGKAGPMSGDPIDLDVTVMAVVPDHSQRCFETRVALGLSVWLRHGGIDIAVGSIRTQVYGSDALTGLGISLADKRLVVVKSSGHYEAEFAPLADHLWHVTAPGALNLDFENFPYTKRDGDYFPRVADPWSLRGRPAPLALTHGEAADA